ncbi:3-oxoacyl-[acyl-carrier-protein] reductase (NADPH) [Saccharomycopsis crataegensis]|uniref:3-oxoacyl-[acyl-carrier-protein] reductase (NADPH) n=1 Tax=Saccharomycopsis crataegensis TaxID=43959 RepID=A0AAV5QL50_9ASCO|nr:3-oxoacyl-[acyl-carrier-protein] reductase (NADPH) [Saccharomycopsis crataegensis]
MFRINSWQIPFRRFFHLSSSSSGKLENNTALITGGSRGLGLSIARSLASEGSNVVLCGRNSSSLQENVSKLPIIHEGQKHAFISCDLSDIEEINKRFTIQPKKDSVNLSMADHLLQKTNILINCAGVMQTSLLLQTSTDEISKIVNTNLLAPIVLSQKLSKIMMRPSVRKAAPNRLIVNMSSGLGEIPFKGTSVYGATKSGLNIFTRTLASELQRVGIRVNCISPGLIRDTDMGQTDVIREQLSDISGFGICEKKDVVQQVMNLIQDATVSGKNIPVGFTR